MLRDEIVSLALCGEDLFNEMMETERQDPFSGCISCKLESRSYAKSLFYSKGKLCYAITRNEDNAFLGYCTVIDSNADPWELGISLMHNYRGKGFGSRAMKLLIEEAHRLHAGSIVALTEPDNYASILMMGNVGAKPLGLRLCVSIPEDSAENIEEEYRDLIDDNLLSLAKLFNVNARKLITHYLVFDLSSPLLSSYRPNISASKRRISLLHNALERKSIYDLLDKFSTTNDSESVRERRANLDKMFADVRSQ